jgi:CelD/BcsL family acetyltransferase involved in cellulose biosynthesis
MAGIDKCTLNDGRAASETPGHVTVTVATSLEALPALRTDWLAVRTRCPRPTPGADPDRFGAALETMRGEADPYVAIFYVDGEPRGAIVGHILRRAITCALGYIRLRTPKLRCLDVVYGGLMADEACLPAERLVSHLREYLEGGHVDLVFVDHVRVDGSFYAALVAAGAVATDLCRHWYFDLVPGSYPDTIAGFSKKHRQNMRRADRLVAKHFRGDVQLRRFTRPEEVAEFTRGAGELNSHTYQAALGIGFTDSPLWRSVLGIEAERGRMRCYWLQCEGRPIAFHAGVLYGQTFFLERIAFLPDFAKLSPGSVLHVRVIQDLCAAGATKLDYGVGHALYKEIYGTDYWDESNLCLYGRGLKTRISRGMQTAMRRANEIALTVARATGVERRLRRAWRKTMGRTSGDGQEADSST